MTNVCGQLNPLRSGAPVHSAIRVACFAILFMACAFRSSAQNVSIGTAAANNSALLHLESTTQGFLAPRMTNTQMLAISTPATGDIVYNTTYANFYYYTGTVWIPMAGGNNWSLTGNSGTSPTTYFLGTKDSVDLVQKTDNNERLRVFAAGNVGLTNVTNSAEALIFYEPSGSGTLYTGFKAGIQSGTVHYILPPSDGLPNQALVTDGAGNLSWHTFATFGGSGSESLWKRGSASGGEYSDSTGASSSGPYSLAAGYHTNVTGNYEIVFGDSTQGVSGSYGAVNGGSGNASSGDKDVVAGGQDNSASATSSYIGGGSSNSTSGDEEVVLGGQKNSFSGSNSTIIGGYNNKTSCNQELLYGLLGATAGTCASVVFKDGSNTRMGVGTVSPTQALDVVGNVRFSGALKPAGSGGSSGYYLLSAGTNTAPTWGTIVVPSTSWRLTGNIGSNPAINFIGTTDAQDFVMSTNAVAQMRITATGFIGIATSSPSYQLTSVYSGTATETAAAYGAASGATSSQSIAGWGTANNTSTSNTGSIGLLGTGNGNTAGGSTDVALQISQGELAMGRTTQSPSAGTVTEGATTHTAWSQQGPSGVIQLSLGTDLNSLAPVAGVFQDLGTVTINNQFITANSIIVVAVIQEINGGGSPDPKNSVYQVQVKSRTAGSCVLHLSLIPYVTEANTYQGSDYIRVGYAIINPGR